MFRVVGCSEVLEVSEIDKGGDRDRQIRQRSTDSSRTVKLLFELQI